MDAATRDYLDSLGVPPEAITWPDERFYPALVPPRVFAFLNRWARHRTGRPLPAR